jgi:integrase
MRSGKVALTQLAILKAKPKDKPYRLYDGDGLYLQVEPGGGKLWRLKYRFDGKERKLSFGKYPLIGLAEARDRRDAARKMVADGQDPSRERQRRKLRDKEFAPCNFEALTAEYCERRKNDGQKPWAPSTAKRCEYLLSLIVGQIGKQTITDIEPMDVLAAVRRIEKKGNLESARRAMQLTGAVLRYGVATARLTSDPTRDLRGAILNPKVEHYGALIEPRQLGQLLRSIDNYDGYGLTKFALQIAPHVFVRPGELRNALWNEIDLDAELWTIPPEKMKMRKPHLVPLSRQVIELLDQVRAITGPSGYVFPSIRTPLRPMSDNTMNAALRRLGYTTKEMTSHGFRATASTLLNESGKWSWDAIERALAHGDPNQVRATYHRGAHWKERVLMAQWWSDYLDALREGEDGTKLLDSPCGNTPAPPTPLREKAQPAATWTTFGAGTAAFGTEGARVTWMGPPVWQSKTGG